MTAPEHAGGDEAVGQVAEIDGAQRHYLAGGESVSLAVQRRTPRSKAAKESLDPIVRTLLDERERRELTGRDVTRAIGGSASDVSRWERGLSEPSLRRLRQWAASLGYDVVLVPATSPGSGGDS